MPEDVVGGVQGAFVGPIPEGPSADYEVGLESLSQWQLAWRKFKKHRLALIGLGILLTLFIVAIIGPILIPFEFSKVPAPDVIVAKGRPPSLQHIFGETGGLQRDVFLLVVNGAKWSLLIGFSRMFIGAFIRTDRGPITRHLSALARR